MLPGSRSPVRYIVAANDRTVQPELQRFVAKRMGATTTEVASSHVPMPTGFQDTGRETQPDDDRMGELLLSGTGGTGNRAKPNRTEAAKRKPRPLATGRLQPLRLFSTPPNDLAEFRNLKNGLSGQRARSRNRFEPVRLATIRAPLFITTWTRAVSYGSMDATYSRLMRWDRWILKKFAPLKRPSRSDNRMLTKYSFVAVKIVT